VARTPFQVEVLTPEGEAFNDEVEMVSTRTSVGSIGVLANHAPLLGMLDPTELRLYKSESDVVRYAQGEGFLQVYGNHVLLLVDEIFEVDELNSGDLEERLSRAESEAEKAEEGSEERRAAERDTRRYEAFLKLAEAGSSGPFSFTASTNEGPPESGPSSLRRVAPGYGLVVESVNVSVFAYPPVRSGSVSAIDCLKVSVALSRPTGEL
jgi:F-type H+-transporting ATPase subunit epsilon